MRSAPGDGSTDDPDELFDLVDADDQVIGQVRRGDAHRDPALLHRSVQVLVFSSDARLLLQRRSRHKDLFPGYYCASASGHVARGDDYGTTATRETLEELGVAPPLAFFARTIVRSREETELTAIYLAHSDGPFHFHPTETEGGIFLPLPEIRWRRAAGNLSMTPALLAALDELDRRERATSLDALLATL